MNPLFFTVVLPAMVDTTKLTKAPLLEPWMYPPQWYPLTTSVLHSGLGGLWGKFWHQMFRFGITEPSRILIKKFQLKKEGITARLLQLTIAFTLSGSIHAASSYTTTSVNPTYPISGPFSFFLAQGAGILAQTSLVQLLHKDYPSTKSFPRFVRQGTNLMFVLTHLYFTGPLLANDFARSGLWLFEPIPISIFRGLGFGPGGKDEGWWAWYQDGSTWFRWWTGHRWWDTGLAIW
jgi:hypothetical protein